MYNIRINHKHIRGAWNGCCYCSPCLHTFSYSCSYIYCVVSSSCLDDRHHCHRCRQCHYHIQFKNPHDIKEYLFKLSVWADRIKRKPRLQFFCLPHVYLVREKWVWCVMPTLRRWMHSYARCSCSCARRYCVCISLSEPISSPWWDSKNIVCTIYVYLVFHCCWVCSTYCDCDCDYIYDAAVSWAII